jgi:hypothetical protein
MKIPDPEALVLTATLDVAAPSGALAAALAEAGVPGAVVPTPDEPAFEKASSALFAVLQILLRRNWLRAGAIARRAGGPLPCPDVPLLLRLHAAAFQMADVEACYARPEAVMTIPGATVERVGDIVLVGRALHGFSDFDFLSAILPGQWHLARAARRGRVDYDIGPVPDWARGTFAAGPRGLREVMRRNGEVLLSCEDDEVKGHEVYAIRDMLRSGAVRKVKVLFLSEGPAREQAQPLIEAGAEVDFLCDDGSEGVVESRQ